MDSHEYEELFPPDNFAMVDRGLYRSAFIWLAITTDLDLPVTTCLRLVPNEEKLFLSSYIAVEDGCVKLMGVWRFNIVLTLRPDQNTGSRTVSPSTSRLLHRMWHYTDANWN